MGDELAPPSIASDAQAEIKALRLSVHSRERAIEEGRVDPDQIRGNRRKVPANKLKTTKKKLIFMLKNHLLKKKLIFMLKNHLLKNKLIFMLKNHLLKLCYLCYVIVSC
ncbi:hypothetical protein C5167_016501 [Papaver somniferum]|nr:hypothetical protein C5167_016501 [Papaver somniferum]